MIQNWWRQYTQMQWERKILWTAVGLSIPPLVAAFIWQSSGTPEPVPTGGGIASIDTYIPKGHVLVPIEVTNQEALDSIMGQFALVDLFQGESPSQQRPVAKNVRILRAPQNPQHFAILVPDRDVDGIMKYGGAFTVVVKRMGQAGTEFVKESKQVRRKVVYDGGT